MSTDNMSYFEFAFSLLKRLARGICSVVQIGVGVGYERAAPSYIRRPLSKSPLAQHIFRRTGNVVKQTRSRERDTFT